MAHTGNMFQKNGSVYEWKEQRKNTSKKGTLHTGNMFTSTGERDTKTNRGSHTGYVLGNLGIGLMQPLEGLHKFLVGTTAQLTGDKAYAKYVYSKSLTGDWQAALDKSYNPGKGMEFFGDVSSGLGQAVTYAGLVYLTGGLASAAGGSSAVVGVAQSAPILLSGTGSGTSEAVQRTGELRFRENAYGVLSGAMEMGLEKISSVGGAVGRLTGTAGATERITRWSV